jgi:hypothetical protein
MWDRRARVLADKDGDTLRIVIDQGFGDSKALDLRLFTTFAPEHNEPGGPETAAFVVDWLARHSPEGAEWPFVATFERTRAGTHEVTTLGRYVGTLATPSGETLNAAVTAFVDTNGYGHGTGS